MNNAVMDVAEVMQSLGRAARNAAGDLAGSTGEQRDAALRSIALQIRRRADEILSANRDDIGAAKDRGIGGPLLDRLLLNSTRIEQIAAGLESISELPNPVGRIMAGWEQPNGLRIERVAVPLGVIGIIYESRPNVTADAAALCLKSGNAVLLRGGSESFRSNLAIYDCVSAGLVTAELPANSVQMVPTRDRDAVGYLLSSMTQWLDVVIPRGGKSLIKRVQEEARVPVIGHLDGICHVYVHSDADTAMARDVVLNAKMRRTGICGAAETVLVDRNAANRLLPEMCDALSAAGCEIRGDEAVRRIVPASIEASATDWTTEYLDAVVSMRVVDDIDCAIDHISRYGSGHTESIITDNKAAAEKFLRDVDSAIVLHNASTQFADGGEFGMGAEIGIATGRIHARGPVGAEQLTSYKYVVRGNGQVRP